jgi:hypothetical protein
MMAAISRNFDLDQSSNLLARSTYEIRLNPCGSSPFWGSPNRYRPYGG